MLDISLNNITVNFGFGNVLNNISLDIKRGEIVSLIGDNGSGKSTILRIIMGEYNPNSGTVMIRKDANIGYLSQKIMEEDNSKVIDILYKSLNNILEIDKKLKNYEEKMTKTSGEELDKIINKYTRLQDEFIRLGGYIIKEKVNKIVSSFNLENLLDTRFYDLSGGEKRIVTLASIIMQNPDILLLDEPTNHLDIEAIEWLENFLKSYKGTFLLVSHDRMFLDKVSTKTILVKDGKLDIYYGNYSYFLEENKVRLDNQIKNYKNNQKQITKMEKSIKRLREFGRIGDNERFFKRAASMEKRLDKLPKVEKIKEDKDIPLTFNLGNRSGEDVLKITNLNINFEGKMIFNEASLEIKFQDRVCLIGPNGSGKSTLIKEILKNKDNIKLGSNVKIGYIPQEINFPCDKTLYEIAKESFKGDETHLRSSLAKFMFSNDNIYKKISKLSGGEKVRLKLFCLRQEEINFLILDEPTNHIDIKTREILEKELLKYSGTILFVSHDRSFINKIAAKVVTIESGKLKEYYGNYDDYKLFRDYLEN